jgi:hypothetical protein
MELKLEIYGNEMQAAQLELLIKILGTQKATISLLCEKFAKDGEADAVFRETMIEAGEYSKKILEDLFARRGHVNPDDISPKKDT